MKIAEAFVEIRPDTSQFEGEVKRKAQSLGTTFAGIFGAVAFGAGLKKAIDSASNLNETVSKSRQLFGAAGREMESMADKAAKTMGLSKRAYLDAAAGLKGLLDNLGLADEQSVEWSKSLVQLGSDLASFYNTSTEDAALAIQSALRGEQEPIRRYNVNIDEARIKTKAFELGLYDGKGAIDSSAKAQAILALITEQSSAAQGDFARTADGVANSQRIAAAETENASASMGQSLLPVYERAVQMVGWLAEAFGSLPAPMQLAFLGLAAIVALAGPVSTLKGAVTGAVAAIQNLSTAGKITAGALGALGAVLVIATIAYSAYNQQKADAKQRTDELRDALLAEAGAQNEALAAMAESDVEVQRFLETMKKQKVASADVAEYMQKGTGAVDEYVDAWQTAKSKSDAIYPQLFELARAVGDERILQGADNWRDWYNSVDQATIDSAADLRNWIEQVEGLRAAEIRSQQTLELVNTVTGNTADVTGNAADATAGLDAEVRKLSDDYAALLGELDNRDAFRNMEDGLDAVAAAASALFDASDPRPLEEKQRAYQQALDDSTRDLLAWADTLAAKIPEEQVTKIRTLIDQGSYDYARALLRAFEVGNTMTFEVVPHGNPRGPMQSFDAGGYIDRDQVAKIHRNEVVLPLSNPARVAALLGDPRVAPAMAAAGAGGTTGATGGGMGGGDTYNLYGWSETQIAELERRLDARKVGRR